MGYHPHPYRITMHHTTIATTCMLTLITTLLGVGFYLLLTTPVATP